MIALDRLRDNLELMPLATEEMIRWATPVEDFMRAAAEDTTVRGVPIAVGDSVLLSYVSANRDDEVFSDPSVSTWVVIPTGIWLSVTACTSASAPHWPARL